MDSNSEIQSKDNRKPGTRRKRPDAEKLLAKIKAQETEASKGKLKIFLGFAAGVGKTYAMLEAGHRLLKDGIDVVAGCVVTHGRLETEALLKGLPSIPLKTIEYKGAQLNEFDLDAVLARRPAYVLFDELAHTNVAGSRHDKRYQDVEELLDAGINVYATLNVQHLESNSDIVAQITNIAIRETVPDTILERANEIELIDITPEELIQRFHEGKVYMPEQSELALEHFFRKGNLIALRELSLRVAAEKIDVDMQHYREDEDIQSIWPVSEKFVVCVSASPLSARLVRTTKRLASNLHAEWLAVYVQTVEHTRLSQRSKNRLFKTLNLAERLGAQVFTLTGTTIAEEILSFARARNVTKIVIGKSTARRLKYLRDRLFGSLVEKIILLSGEIDVYVITGDPLPGEITPHYREPVHKIKWDQYVYALAIVTLATFIDHLVFHKLKQVNLVMVYLLAIVFAATRYGPGPSALASILSVACFDFFFVPPYMSFAVSDIQYLLTLLVMLTVSLTLSIITVRSRQQMELTKQRERQTAALFAMTREQVSAASIESILAASLKHLNEVFDSKVVIFLPDKTGSLKADFQDANSYTIDSHEMGVAQWVFSNKQVAGASTSTLPGAKAVYLPLLTTNNVVGVIGLLPQQKERLQIPEEMHFLETFVYQIALAVERAAGSKTSS
jgi:two-component system, OmpR family, sensor histidine kinase KdpD